jgi:hypothetical protein
MNAGAETSCSPFWGALLRETLSPIFNKYDMTMVTNLAEGHS